MTRKERSYLMPGLDAEDRKLLADLPRKAALVDEIGYLRLRLRRMAEEPDETRDERLLVRMLTLLTRMVEVQAKLGNSGQEMGLAELNTLILKRLQQSDDGGEAPSRPADRSAHQPASHSG